MTEKMENQPQLPQLICPKYHTPIMVVRVDTNDILRSKLLSSRSLCEAKEIYSHNESLQVIEDFLHNVLEPSSIVNQTSLQTQQALAKIDELKSDFLSLQSQAQKSNQERHQEQQDILKEKCDGIASILSRTSQFGSQQALIDQYAQQLSAIADYDPQEAVNIPKTQAILEKLNELQASPDLPEYLFGLVKRQKAWKQNAPQHLREWKQHQETFYRERFFQSLTLQENSEAQEAAFTFVVQQLNQVKQQVQQIMEEDSSHKLAKFQSKYLDLPLDTPESLALVTNQLLTPETRLQYKLGSEFTLESSESIVQTLQRLTDLKHLEIIFQASDETTPGLSRLAQGILTLTHLKSLFINARGSTITSEQAKEFFQVIAKRSERLSLTTLHYDFDHTTLTKDGAIHVAKSISSLSNPQLQSLTLHFNVDGTALSHEFSSALGESLSECKKLTSLTLDIGGYSLHSNEIKDKGFVPIIKSFEIFAETISTLNLNFSKNELTDEAMVLFYKSIKAALWPRLKDFTLVLHRNNISSKGVEKLTKVNKLLNNQVLQNFPILLKLNLNLGCNRFDIGALRSLLRKLPQHLLQTRINVRGCNLNEDEVSNLVGGNSKLKLIF